MSTMNPLDPYGGTTPPIEQMLGNAYDNVRKVAQNIDAVKAVNANKENIDKAAQISDDVMTLKEEMEVAVSTSQTAATSATTSANVARASELSAKDDAISANQSAQSASQSAITATSLVGSVKKAILYYNTFPEAQADAATLPDGQVVDVGSDQKRYKVEAGYLVFKENFLRSDIAGTNGSALVGYDGGTVQEALDNTKPMADYAELRAYAGRHAKIVNITAPGISGSFDYDPADTTSADDGGTKIIDAEGRRWHRSFSGGVNASWFGFSVEGSGSQNSSAITNAINAYAGRVFVYAERDFELDSVTISNRDLDVEFVGSGKVLRESGSSFVFQHTADYVDIQPVSSISRATVNINGSSGAATAVAVQDASKYKRADVVKIVSDDIDSYAAIEQPRRLGEFAVVAQVNTSTNTVYLSTLLEDQSLYVTNPRIARLPKFKSRAIMPGVKSNLSHTGFLFRCTAGYRPEWYTKGIENHGWICTDLYGCFEAELYAEGAGKGDSSGSLGYLVNDTSGQSNRIIRPKGHYFRHVTTTNFNSIEAGSTSIHAYGATRDHYVLMGTAFACQGVPWDDHPGARRSVWDSCESAGYIRNTSTANAAYQLRGRDPVIKHPKVDSSFGFMMRIGVSAEGNINVYGGDWNCVSIDDARSTIVNKVTVNIYDGSGHIKTGPNLLFSSTAAPMNADVNFYGGKFGYTGLTSSSNNAQFVSAARGCRIRFYDTELFAFVDASSPITAFRCFTVGEALERSSSVSGRVKLNLGPSMPLNFLFRSTDASASAIMKLTALSAIPAFTDKTGAFVVAKYVMSFPETGESRTNFTDFTDYLSVAGS